MNKPPSSAVSHWTGISGLAGLTAGFTLMRMLDLSPESGVVCMILSCAAPMLWHERSRSGYAPHDAVTGSTEPAQVSVRQHRLPGLLLAAMPWLASLTVFNFFAPEKTAGFWEVFFFVFPFLVLVILVYLSGWRMKGGGSIETLGRMLRAGEFGNSRWWTIWRVHWLKAFFLPLMISFAYNWAANLDKNLDVSARSEISLYFVVLSMMYLIDVIFGTIGYLASFRSAGSEIRSTDSTWGGWLVALACYPPFFGWLTLLGVTAYRDDVQWYQWLGTTGNVFYVWGVLILVLTGIYAWATVIFGLRFSNLTHRGIITNGPFRYTKHPAYIAKNLSWWMISVPFISHEGALVAVGHCAALLFVNFIYFLRARTEERHLSADPAYREYAQWIREHGALSRLRRFGVPRIRLGGI